MIKRIIDNYWDRVGLIGLGHEKIVLIKINKEFNVELSKLSMVREALVSWIQSSEHTSDEECRALYQMGDDLYRGIEQIRATLHQGQEEFQSMQTVQAVLHFATVLIFPWWFLLTAITLLTALSIVIPTDNYALPIKLMATSFWLLITLVWSRKIMELFHELEKDIYCFSWMLPAIARIIQRHPLGWIMKPCFSNTFQASLNDALKKGYTLK